MSTYVILFSFTQKGVEKIKELPARVEDAKRTIAKMGGEVIAFYAIAGSQYDTLFIVKSQSDEKLAGMALAIASLGNVRTESHRLFNEEEVKAIVSSLP
ncbi:MAG TPA: GYD domain-containing protein [Acidobacteriaceae bacterium]|nr:GYD domain-containing protein [Acidobacteriaceae bacterium]